MSRVRVLHVLPDLHRGTRQTVVRHLATRHDAERFDVHVARVRPPDRSGSPIPGLDGELIRLDVDGLAGSFELARHIRHRNIDLVHLHGGDDRTVGLVAAALSRRPAVGHLHSTPSRAEALADPPEGKAGVNGSGAKGAVRRSLVRRTVRHYLAAGDEVAAAYEGRVGAPIAIVPTGVDTQQFRPRTPADRRRIRSAMGLDASTPLLVCIGQQAAGKGQEELLGVLADLPGAHLVLAGGGDEWRVVEQLASWLGVADRVHIVGPRTDVAELMAAADLFVSTMTADGSPGAIVESMATGVPVVAYDLPDYRSAITNAVDGCLVRPGDTATFTVVVRALLSDQRLREHVGQAARATAVQRFDVRSMARATEAVYDLVLGIDPLEARRNDGQRLVTTL